MEPQSAYTLAASGLILIAALTANVVNQLTAHLRHAAGQPAREQLFLSTMGLHDNVQGRGAPTSAGDASHPREPKHQAQPDAWADTFTGTVDEFLARDACSQPRVRPAGEFQPNASPAPAFAAHAVSTRPARVTPQAEPAPPRKPLLPLPHTRRSLFSIAEAIAQAIADLRIHTRTPRH